MVNDVGEMLTLNVIRTYPASTNRKIGDPSFFDQTQTLSAWELMYKIVMDPKYAKNTRGFSTTITGTPQDGNVAPIYLIPRERGGPSYLSVPLEGVDANHVQYCPISKGFPMQDVSSFSLGPIVGEGLCLVNAAFSKSICVGHIEGGGVVDLQRKNFWKRARKPIRNIQVIDADNMIVDGVSFDIRTWLRSNEQLWYPQWELWRRSIALCSRGDFHWTDGLGETLVYRKGIEYLNFVRWKKECYIRPSYELLPSTRVYQFLHQVWAQYNIPLGLVHPMAILGTAEVPISPQFIRNLYDSPYEMCCQPYVVSGLLLGVSID